MDNPALPAHGAMKRGVNSLTESAAVTYGPEGIRVNAIAPGNTRTETIRTWEADSPGLSQQLAASTPSARPRGVPPAGTSSTLLTESMPTEGLPSSECCAAMTTIGFIGSGHIGSTLARLAVPAGYDVVLSNSRGPETLADLVSDLGPRARAATAAEAAAAGELVVVTIPLKAVPDVPVEPLAGKVVIDTGNYYPDRDGTIAGLEDESTTTSELLQAHLPTAHVVKAFNNIFFKNLAELARPTGDPRRSALPIAGDDNDAKKTAATFLDDIGYDAHDVGPLSEGWRYQRDTPAYVTPYADAAHDMASRQSTAADLAPLLAAAKRYRDMG